MSLWGFVRYPQKGELSMSRAERLRQLYEVVWDLSQGGEEPVSFEAILTELVRRDLEELADMGLLERVGDDCYASVA